MFANRLAVKRNSPQTALAISGASKSVFGGTLAEGRTSSATYSENGVSQTAAANVPVWENGGLRHEGQATNLQIQSNAFTTTWAKNGVMTITQDATGPDGTTSAWTMVDSDTSVEQAIYLSPSLAAATQYTLYFCIKKTTGAQASYPLVLAYRIGTARIAIATVDTSNGLATIWTDFTGFTILPSSASVRSLNSDYWLVALTFTTVEAATYYQKLIPAGTNNPTQSTGAAGLTYTGSAIVCNSQLVTGDKVSSYIPTTTVAVTRATCALSIPLVLNTNFYQRSAILMRVRAKHANSATAKSWLTASTTAEGLIDNGSGALTFKDSAANTATANLTSWADDTVILVAIVTDNVTGLMSLSASKDNGVTWITSTDTAFAGLTVGANWLFFSANTQVFEMLGFKVKKSNKGFNQMKSWAMSHALSETQ